jgi:hypothetical protein
LLHLHHMCACGSGWWLEETQARCADLQARFFLAQVRLVVRCTFNYVGAPGDPQVHLEIPRRPWQVRFCEKIYHTGAPGYQRHHRRTFCDCVRSQGAPVERLHKPLVEVQCSRTSDAELQQECQERFAKLGGEGIVSPQKAVALCRSTTTFSRKDTAAGLKGEGRQATLRKAGGGRRFRAIDTTGNKGLPQRLVIKVGGRGRVRGLLKTTWQPARGGQAPPAWQLSSQ